NLYQNDMTGINWAKMPTAILEMGFMSNPTEDRNLADAGFQKKIAKGVADGIDKFFMEKE
ncbi:MAG: N-acetylmuramoyl-L-alanine amidase, partial [Lachnospiraceae bacterium]|nr:N-acetylmuramoyl-L-alanine amidase [Lachnospiraceae bacterium]